MLFSELREKTRFCGYEIDDIELIHCANLALREIFTTQKIIRNVRLASGGIHRVSHYPIIDCKSGDRFEIPLNGKAFSMRVKGSGQYMLREGSEFNVFPIESGEDTMLIKKTVGTSASITLWTSYSMTVYDLSVYDRIYSMNIEDIPDGLSVTTYDIRSLYGDFMSFVAPPTDAGGVPISNYNMYDGRLEVDSEYEGEILLHYRRLPVSIVGAEEDEEIDIPSEYEYLLPLLAASYAILWIDEPRSKYLRSLYEAGLAALNSSSLDQLNTSYIDVHGWA